MGQTSKHSQNKFQKGRSKIEWSVGGKIFSREKEIRQMHRERKNEKETIRSE
jgi:hypothetical protein